MSERSLRQELETVYVARAEQVSIIQEAFQAAERGESIAFSAHDLTVSAYHLFTINRDMVLRLADEIDRLDR